MAGVRGGVEEGGNGVLLRATSEEGEECLGNHCGCGGGVWGSKRGRNAEGLCAEGLCVWVRSRQPIRGRHVVGVAWGGMGRRISKRGARGILEAFGGFGSGEGNGDLSENYRRRYS